MAKKPKDISLYRFPTGWDYELYVEHLADRIPIMCFRKKASVAMRARYELLPELKDVEKPNDRYAYWLKYIDTVKKQTRFERIRREKSTKMGALGRKGAEARWGKKPKKLYSRLRTEKGLGLSYDLYKSLEREIRGKEPLKSCDYVFYEDRPGKKYQTTTNVYLIRSMRGRIRILQGGARASKTVGAFDSIINDCVNFDKSTNPNGITAIVGGMSYPNLRANTIDVFIDMMHDFYGDGAGGFTCGKWNQTMSEFKFHTGSTIKFMVFDHRSKVEGVAPDIVFLNEAWAIPEYVFDALNRRLKMYMIIDYNPTGRFWVHDKIIPNYKAYGAELLDGLTFLGNECLSDNQVVSMVSEYGVDGNDRNKRIYIYGELGEHDMLVFKPWEIINASKDGRHIPHEAQLICRGLDFGFRDPAAIVAVYRFKNGFLFDEEFYQTEATIDQLRSVLNSVEKKSPIVADRSGASLIEELRRAGITNIIPSRSLPNSRINDAIYINSQRIWVTARSKNLIYERDHYFHKVTGAGDAIGDIPLNQKDHALDAARYSMQLAKGGGHSELVKDNLKEYNKKARSFVGQMSPLGRQNNYGLYK